MRTGMGMMWMSVVEGMRGKIRLGTGVWSSLVMYCTTLERIDDHQSTLSMNGSKSPVFISVCRAVHAIQVGI